MPIYVRRYISDDVTTNASTCAFRYIPGSAHEIDQKGELHGLITVVGEEGLNADRIAKFVWDGVVDAYGYGKNIATVELLKNAINAGSRKVVELIKNEKVEHEINLSFSLAVVKGMTAYLGVFGEQQLFLFKDNGIVKISEIIQKNKGVVASIAISDNDLILMSSPSLLDAFVEINEDLNSQVELLENIDEFTQNLTNHQSVLLLARKDLEVKEVENREIIAPIISATTEEEAIEEPIPEEKEEIKIEKKRFGREDLSKVFERIKLFFRRASLAISPALNKLANLVGKVREKTSSIVLDKYGRQRWYKRIAAKLSSIKFGKRSGAYGMKIDGYKIANQRNKRILIVLLIFGLILLVLMGAKLSANAKIRRDIHKEAVVILDSIGSFVTTAQNEIAGGNDDDAAVAIYNANAEVEKLKDKVLSVDDTKRFNDLKTTLSGLDDKVNRRFGVTESDGTLSLFIDGRIQFGDLGNLTDLTSYKDSFQNEFLFVVDNGNKKVVKISLEDKTNKAVPDKGKLLSAPRYIDYGNYGLFVYDDQKGVLRSAFTKSGNADFEELAGLGVEDMGNGSIVDLGIFTSGSSDNVYLVNSDKKAIFKSLKYGTGYGLPFNYLSLPSLSTATDIMGDFSIYVLSKGAPGINRFSYSYTKKTVVSDPVTISGMVEDLTNLDCGFIGAKPDSRMIVFDGVNKTFILLKKPSPNDMTIDKQFVYRGSRTDIFNDVRDVAMDYNNNYAYILDGNTIWKMKLK
ncbi:hypothetical protein M0R04_02850 [Candidatus Dojkabacteria bacterium]|jgi:hypothetical protein|nr:hypothetical protein [Candidatus Dojkabacteria bacterium]